jgi:small nuclear ribonucleoprotein (snRNP)-like protein
MPSPAEQHTTQIALHLAHVDGRRLLVSTTDDRLISGKVHGFGNGMVTLTGYEIADVAAVNNRRDSRVTLRIEEIASVQPVPAVRPVR